MATDFLALVQRDHVDLQKELTLLLDPIATPAQLRGSLDGVRLGLTAHAEAEDIVLGRFETISLLDDMNQLGFRFATRSGLSFATDDLITPEAKGRIIAAAEKEVLRKNKLYQRGIITEGERYNQVLDAWTHARPGRWSMLGFSTRPAASPT